MPRGGSSKMRASATSFAPTTEMSTDMTGPTSRSARTPSSAAGLSCASRARPSRRPRCDPARGGDGGACRRARGRSRRRRRRGRAGAGAPRRRSRRHAGRDRSGAGGAGARQCRAQRACRSRARGLSRRRGAGRRFRRRRAGAGIGRSRADESAVQRARKIRRPIAAAAWRTPHRTTRSRMWLGTAARLLRPPATSR